MRCACLSRVVPALIARYAESPVTSLFDRIGGRARAAMLALLAYQGFVLATNGVAAPWMMHGFALDQRGIARLFAVTSLSALGAFLLARLADRVGRRAVLIACATATPLCALGAALSALPVL